MSPVCKMTDNGRLTVDQKVKVVLFYAETKSVITTQRRFRAHFGTRWAPCKQTVCRLSLGTIFQPMRINSVPDVQCFCNNKNVLCVQSMVWHFVRHPICIRLWTISNFSVLSLRTFVSNITDRTLIGFIVSLKLSTAVMIPLVRKPENCLHVLK